MSAAIEQFQPNTWPVIFILTAQLLHVHACMKGEECIVVAWDIFHEKWGRMLIDWNMSGVPFVYAIHAHYIFANPVRTNDAGTGMFKTLLFIIFTLLVIVYYLWDSSLAQKIQFILECENVEHS